MKQDAYKKIYLSKQDELDKVIQNNTILSKDLQFEINKNAELKHEYESNVFKMNSEIENLFTSFDFYKKENFDLKENLEIILNENNLSIK